MVSKDNVFSGRTYFLLQTNSGANYVYFPLLSCMLTVNQAAANIIANGREEMLVTDCPQYEDASAFLSQRVCNASENAAFRTYTGGSCVKDQYIGTNAALLLTTDCNLRCGYCYSSGGVATKRMSREIAKSIIDLLLRNGAMRKLSGRNACVNLTFLGDGEPTCHWDVLQFAIEYLKTNAHKAQIGSIVSLTTNALLSADRAQWIAKNVDSISVSFDGIREVQDLHRPLVDGTGSFDSCIASLKIINDESRSPFGVHMTATNESIDKLSQCVEFVFKEFPCVSGISVEPMLPSPVGRINLSTPDPWKLAKALKEARAIARKYKKILVCSLFQRGPHSAYCGGAILSSIFVTADGHITSCTQVTNPDDERWPQFWLGEYDKATKRPAINVKQSKEILARANTPSSDSKCKNCFLQWQCGRTCQANIKSKYFLCEAAKLIKKDVLDEYATGEAIPDANQEFLDDLTEIGNRESSPIIFQGIGFP